MVGKKKKVKIRSKRQSGFKLKKFEKEVKKDLGKIGGKAGEAVVEKVAEVAVEALLV